MPVPWLTEVVADGEAAIERLLARPEVAHINCRNAAYGAAGVQHWPPAVEEGWARLSRQ